MTFEELSHDQQIALVALVEAVVMSDGVVSEGDQSEITKLAEGLGVETYRRLLDQADTRFPDLESLKQYLQTIEDRNARELIYGTILDETMASPTVEGTGAEILDWLRSTWGVDEVESP